MRKMSEKRKAVYSLIHEGARQRAKLNLLVGFGAHDQQADIDQLLRLANTRQLQGLLRAMHENRLVRQAYRCVSPDGGTSGCLVFHLFGFKSHDEFFQWDVPDDVLFAVNRVMRGWDFDVIDELEIRDAVALELQRREQSASPPPAPAKLQPATQSQPV